MFGGVGVINHKIFANNLHGEFSYFLTHEIHSHLITCSVTTNQNIMRKTEYLAYVIVIIECLSLPQ